MIRNGPGTRALEGIEALLQPNQGLQSDDAVVILQARSRLATLVAQAPAHAMRARAEALIGESLYFGGYQQLADGWAAKAMTTARYLQLHAMDDEITIGFASFDAMSGEAERAWAAIGPRVLAAQTAPESQSTWLFSVAEVLRNGLHLDASRRAYEAFYALHSRQRAEVDPSITQFSAYARCAVAFRWNLERHLCNDFELANLVTDQKIGQATAPWETDMALRSAAEANACQPPASDMALRLTQLKALNLYLRGDLSAARALATTAATTAERAGQRNAGLWLTLLVGKCHLQAGQLEAAVACFTTAKDGFLRWGKLAGEAEATLLLATALARLRRPGEALQHVVEHRQIADRIGRSKARSARAFGMCLESAPWLAAWLRPIQVSVAERPVLQAASEAVNDLAVSADAYMRGALQTKLGVLDVCRSLNVSRRTLEAAFNRKFGCAPAAHFRALKLQAIKHEIEESNDSLAVIHRRYGFDRGSTFQRAFKRQFGVAPSSLRERDCACRGLV